MEVGNKVKIIAPMSSVNKCEGIVKEIKGSLVTIKIYGFLSNIYVEEKYLETIK